MKHNKIKHIIGLAVLGASMSGCAGLVTVLPSLIPSLVPSVDVTNVNVNQNEINCFPGSYFTSGYCSIPISKFVALSSNYADPFNNKLLFLANSSDSLAIDSLEQTKTIDTLNKFFIANYPDPSVFAKLPTKLQSVYIKMRERYIPNKDYTNLYKSYVYLYTISVLNFATRPCDEENPIPKSVSIRTFTTTKTFAIQFTNNLLYYIYGSVDGSYGNEMKLYNDIYAQILDTDPYKLVNMAQNVFDQTKSFTPKGDWEDMLSESGISYGEIGTFSCTNNGGFMYRYGYQYFGSHTNGLDLRVKYDIQNPLKSANDKPIQLINN